MAICYLGLGSNLGDKRKNINNAIRRINALKGSRVLACSRLILSKPVGGIKGQPDYLNGAVKIRTTLTPEELLSGLKKIERELGRPKEHRRFGPRVIDLDILFYGSKVINRKNLVIPHPRLFEREFVMRPLAQIYAGN